MPLPLALVAAWPAVSAGLMTAGRFVVMRAAPAIGNAFKAATTTTSATGVTSVSYGKAAITGLAIDGTLGTNIVGGSINTLKDATVGAFNHVTGADEGAGAQPEVLYRKDAEGNMVEIAPAADGTQGPAGQRPAAGGFDLNNFMSSIGDKARDNPAMALGATLGALMGMSKSNGMAEMALKVPLYSAIMGFMFKMLGPILTPFLGTLGLGSQTKLQNDFHGAQLSTDANAAAPGATAAAPAPAANDAVALFRDNAASATAAGNSTPRTPRPEFGFQQPALAMGQ